MRIDQKTVFRKTIVPWYDSEIVCLLTIVFMFLVFLFGFAGVAVARENVTYHDYIWVPVSLIVMSATVIISTTMRLIRRYAYRFSK
jgi:hypothetical protein